MKNTTSRSALAWFACLGVCSGAAGAAESSLSLARETGSSGLASGLAAGLLGADLVGTSVGEASLGLHQPGGGNPAFGPGHQRSWELPPVVVEGESVSGLREEERIGSYGQPRWTATRRFPSTRVYVIPEGKVEVEGWSRATFKRSDQGGETEWRFLQEVEIGLPHRFQLDIYLREDYDTESDDTLWGGQFEVRYALADWGKLPGNPTLYFEYITLEERPDKIEPKVLIGGEFGEGWHWGANFVFEYELSGAKEAEYSVTTALSKTIVDEVFSLGVESVFSATDEKGSRGDFNTSFVIGPSVQWKPVHNATINIAPLFGTTNESPVAQVYLNVGWEF